MSAFKRINEPKQEDQNGDEEILHFMITSHDRWRPIVFTNDQPHTYHQLMITMTQHKRNPLIIKNEEPMLNV